MRHIISILVENEAGALARVVGLFAQRGYNLESLAVAPVEDGSVSQITIVTIGNDRKIEQILKQINKLIDIIKVVDLTENKHIERELLLVKVQAGADSYTRIKQLAEVYSGTILELNADIYILEYSSTCEKIDTFLDALKNGTKVLEFVRSGALGITQGKKTFGL